MTKCLIMLIAAFVLAFAAGYILGFHCPFAPKFGAIVIEKSPDKNENDSVRFMFDKELDDLYSSKLIKLSVVTTEKRMNNNSINEKL